MLLRQSSLVYPRCVVVASSSSRSLHTWRVTHTHALARSMYRQQPLPPMTSSLLLSLHRRQLATSTTGTIPLTAPPQKPASTTSSTQTGNNHQQQQQQDEQQQQEQSQSFFRSDRWTKIVGTVGALANWSIPLAAIAHMASNKDPATTIDPIMTSALAIYSLLFMRWAVAISPPNYPLVICHIANETVQLIQLVRYAAADKTKAKQAGKPNPVKDQPIID